MKRKNAIKWGCALLACALFFGNAMTLPMTANVVHATVDTSTTPDSSANGAQADPPVDSNANGDSADPSANGTQTDLTTTSTETQPATTETPTEVVENPVGDGVDEVAVANTIAAIDAIGEITVDSKASIQNARNLYDSLNDASKAQVTNIDILIASENHFAAFFAEEAAAKEAAAEAQAAAEQAALEQVVSAENDDTDISYAKEGNVTLKGTDASYIFIGDSRTVGMAQYVNTNQHIWSAKVGAGLSWMKSDGVPAVEGKIESGSNVVILMGVNDCGNTSNEKKYATYINEKAKAWVAKGANVYYVSVNPITRDSVSNGSITNAKIETWNANMQADLSSDVTYIDTYNKLKGELVATDGLHYTKRGCQLIYNAILEFVEADTVEEVDETDEETIVAYQTKITSAVRNKEDNTVTLKVTKPTGITNVGCQVALYNTETSTWDIVTESKMDSITIEVPEGKVRVRARVYKKYDTETAEGKWSKTVTINAKGSATGVEKEDSGIVGKVILGVIGAVVIFFGGYFFLRKKNILGPTPLDNVFNFVAELLEKISKKKNRKK